MNANKNRAFYYTITTDVQLGDTIQVGDYSYVVANQSVISGEAYKDMYLIVETDETVQRKIEHAEGCKNRTKDRDSCRETMDSIADFHQDHSTICTSQDQKRLEN